MAKLEQGTDVEITTTLSGGRSKHILKLTGPGRAKLVHAQGTAQALWASLLQCKRVWCRARLRAYRVAP